jgi:hypothetical protein
VFQQNLAMIEFLVLRYLYWGIVSYYGMPFTSKLIS